MTFRETLDEYRCLRDAMFDEAVLLRQLGVHTLMYVQLGRSPWASQLPNVDIRVFLLPVDRAQFRRTKLWPAQREVEVVSTERFQSNLYSHC